MGALGFWLNLPDCLRTLDKRTIIVIITDRRLPSPGRLSCQIHLPRPGLFPLTMKP